MFSSPTYQSHSSASSSSVVGSSSPYSRPNVCANSAAERLPRLASLPGPDRRSRWTVLAYQVGLTALVAVLEQVMTPAVVAAMITTDHKEG